MRLVNTLCRLVEYERAFEAVNGYLPLDEPPVFRPAVLFFAARFAAFASAA
jgi:hypothetical protein